MNAPIKQTARTVVQEMMKAAERDLLELNAVHRNINWANLHKDDEEKLLSFFRKMGR